MLRRCRPQDVLRHVLAPRWHEWLLLGVLLALTDHYRWLMDDAFIYFRYADNLLFLDRGLVYNAGEYVEGYSSPLWMLWITAARALGSDFYFAVRATALACAAAYGLGLIWLNRRLSPGAHPVSFPLAASAAHYGLTTHFSSGLETPLVQALAPLYAAALLRPRSRALQCAMGAAPLVRPECALLWLAYLPWIVARTRRVPGWFLVSAALLNGAWLGFRVLYYADFLPNTFYLKDRPHWDWGWDYLWNVAETHHWPWVLSGLAACAWWGRAALQRTRLGPRAILLSSAILHALYVARVGGDMLYHRYASLPVCLVLCAASGVAESALLLMAASWRSFLAPLGGLSLALLFGLARPWQLETHPFWMPESSRNWQLVADAHWHRQHPSLTYRAPRHTQDRRLRELYARHRERTDTGAAPEIFVEGFCRQGYRRFAAHVIQEYGLTDAVLARLPRDFGRPGHKHVQNEARELRKLLLHARKRGVSAWWELPRAPVWVQNNREALALLDRKIHNRHELGANLKLALTRIQLQ